MDFESNNLTGILPENICTDDTTVWANINLIILKNNQLCPCYPGCVEDIIGDQATIDCTLCSNGDDTLICHIPESVLLNEETNCFNKTNINILQEFIDSSSLEIKPLELGQQYWRESYLDSLFASHQQLSGVIPKNIDSLSLKS
mgnify:CR=1 FL=1